MLCAIPVQADTAIQLSSRVTSMVPALFCAPDTPNRREAPDTMAGYVYQPEVAAEIIAEGQIVPAVIGVGFGVRFTLNDTSDTNLRYTVTHPPMQPGSVTEQSWDGMLTSGTVGTVFFQFDIDAELQPGDWSFMATSDGQELFRVGFIVRPPSALPELLGLCQSGSLLSLNQRSPDASG